MKRFIYVIIAIAIVGLLVFFRVRTPDEKKVQNKSRIPALVNAYVVNSQELENNIFTIGSIIANNSVHLRSEIPGKAVKVLIEEGKRVTQGQLLVKLNDAELQAQLEKLKFQEKLSSDNEFRQRKLLEAKGISQQEYDASLNNLNTIKADIQLIKAQIDKTEIRAPFDGIVGLKNVYTGSFISPDVIIASIQDINNIKIDFSVPEKYAGVIQNSDIIKFSVESSDEQFTAKIYAIEPMIDELTRTIHIRAIAENKNGKILPGSSAKVFLSINRISDAVMIPSQAIVTTQNAQIVYLLKKGKVVSEIVKTGIRNENQIQILSGINNYDTIIISGFMNIKPGDNVRVSSYINN